MPTTDDFLSAKVSNLILLHLQLAHDHAPDVICATKIQRTKPLVSKRLDNTTGRYYLHINEQWKPLYLQESAELTCCLRQTKNVPNNDKLKY